MGEYPRHSENQEKILPNQILLLAEPVFKNPHVDESGITEFTVPLGTQSWAEQFSLHPQTRQKIAAVLANEYIAIASALDEMNVPFRIIVAHRQAIDERITLAIFNHFHVRGVALDKSISETCFPRDMMVDFDGRIYINPRANFYFPDNSGIISPLGEGGRVLKVGKKVFVPDPRGFVQTKKDYVKGIRSLSGRFQFGFLPFPIATIVDTNTDMRIAFPNDHLDRVAALVKGKDNKDYLLLDAHYANESLTPYGNYWTNIKEACQKLDVTPVIIDRKPDSIPYALNLEQFADGSVLLTGGDDVLVKNLSQIVGEDKVHTTKVPIIYYPLYRNGGIRCMLLHAPKRIVGEPVIPSV